MLCRVCTGGSSGYVRLHVSVCTPACASLEAARVLQVRGTVRAWCARAQWLLPFALFYNKEEMSFSISMFLLATGLRCGRL